MLFQKQKNAEKITEAFEGINGIYDVENDVNKNDNKYQNLSDDEHVLHLWEVLDFNLDKDYKFINSSPIFLIFSNLLYAIAAPILHIFNKITFGFKIYGKENLANVKGGKITVSNHVHIMDCTMVGLANFPHKTYFLSLKSNFKIPIVNVIIRLLNAIPIPDDLENKKRFVNAIHHLLKSGKTLHIYPEASLWPYYNGLRNFKDGAFRFAIDCNVPIIPMIYKFSTPTGIWKLIKRKPLVSLHILKPIYPNLSLPKDKAISELKLQTYNAMKNELNI